MNEYFQATVDQMGTTTVLHLSGNVDRAAGPAVEDAYQAAGDARRLVLDFTATSYINSSGIALVVSVLARARAEGRRVAAFGLSEHYREIFEITRLSDFIEICPDLESAVDAAPAGNA
jgi:anti-sigma B factor antagonist